VRRQRLVAVQHRVVCGPMARVKQVLAAGGGQLHTACGDRLHLDIRPRGAAGGRRGNPRCQGEDGVRQQLVLFQPMFKGLGQSIGFFAWEGGQASR
jgi:hypothetical protein